MLVHRFLEHQVLTHLLHLNDYEFVIKQGAT